jgi:hypothetical protein
MKISEQARERIRAQARNRCGYCQSQQQYVFAPLGSAAIASDKGLSKRAKHHEESLPVQDYRFLKHGFYK